jgi:hypothetical protein
MTNNTLLHKHADNWSLVSASSGPKTQTDLEQNTRQAVTCQRKQ